MKLKLQDTISSPQDLRAIILEVREYARWFAHNDRKKSLHISGASARPDISRAADALIDEWESKNPISQRSLDTLIQTLEDFEESAPQMTITLAAPAPNSMKETLVAWCRTNIAQDVLVNFQYNSTLLGGMVVRYGSHVFDWSFRQKILESLNHFPEVLRRV